MLRNIMHKVKEHQQPMCVLWTSRFSHEEFWQAMLDITRSRKQKSD